jgi:hypothetical protein
MGTLIDLAQYRKERCRMGQPRVTGLTVGRDTYRLLFRNQDLQDAERNLDGESWEKSIQERGQRRLNVLLWAALKHSQGQDFTIQKAINIADAANKNGMSYIQLWERLSTALTNSGWLQPPDAPSTEDTPMAGATPVDPTVSVRANE